MSNNEFYQCCFFVILCGVGVMCNFFVQLVENVMLKDVEGNEYIDFVVGIVVLNIGYCYFDLVAVVEQ